MPDLALLQGSHRGGFGLDVADVNGDGLDDLVAGAERYDDDANDRVGFAGIMPGPIVGTGLFDPSLSIVGAEPEQGFGSTVEAESDLDGDGQKDLVVGSCYQGEDGKIGQGAVYLFHLPLEGSYDTDDADAMWVGLEDSDTMGETMASGFDLDADGFDDLAMGAWSWPEHACRGAVYVVRGGPAE